MYLNYSIINFITISVYVYNQYHSCYSLLLLCMMPEDFFSTLSCYNIYCLFRILIYISINYSGTKPVLHFIAVALFSLLFIFVFLNFNLHSYSHSLQIHKNIVPHHPLYEISVSILPPRLFLLDDYTLSYTFLHSYILESMTVCLLVFFTPSPIILRYFKSSRKYKSGTIYF